MRFRERKAGRARAAVCLGACLLCAAFGQAPPSAPPRPQPPAPPPLPPVRPVPISPSPAVPQAPKRVILFERPASAQAATPTAGSPLPGEMPPPARVPVPAAATGGRPAAWPLDSPASSPSALAWDADVKEATLKPGEVEAQFTFYLTNTSASGVLIQAVRTSCGCTVAKLPQQPWPIAPGGSGPIQVTVSMRGKSGSIAKSVMVDTSAGMKVLLVKVTRPPDAAAAADMERLRNMQVAMADRQAVFTQPACAACHLDPGRGKTGGDLFAAVCAICHESPNRASVVPDLRALRKPTDRAYWKQWITSGKPDSMMPAFGQSEAGPLSEAQIVSLAEYLAATLSATEPGPPARPAVEGK